MKSTFRNEKAFKQWLAQNGREERQGEVVKSNGKAPVQKQDAIPPRYESIELKLALNWRRCALVLAAWFGLQCGAVALYSPWLALGCALPVFGSALWALLARQKLSQKHEK